MKKNMLRFATLTLLMTFISTSSIFAQCETWEGKANQEEIMQWHSIYRQEVKMKNYDMAFDHWERAFTAAPAADGKRDSHFMDGITLYKAKLEKATGEEKKAIKAKIIDLYNGMYNCYEAKTIVLRCSTDECYKNKMGFVLGREGYDMYYKLQTPYSKNAEVLNKAIELAGNNSEYIVIVPLANITIKQYQDGKVDADEAIRVHAVLNEIADHNIENNERFKDYYKQAKDAMNASYRAIEGDIYDCEYFKNKLRPEYEADPDNPEVIKAVLAKLKGQGCMEGDPMHDELDAKWKKYAAAENARIQAEFEANNPGAMAKRLYDEGDYEGAVSKYKEAIENETDLEKKAGYQFAMASILFRKLKKLSKAREVARQAAKNRPNWGRPYMLIGDMYATSARNCGDSWNQRLAILAAIDKYNYAKSIDAEQVDDAKNRISQYRGSMPDSNEGFMRTIKEGDVVTVGCWIGESVKVRFK